MRRQRFHFAGIIPAVLIATTVSFPLLATDSVANAVVRGVTARAAEQLVGITPVLANTPFLGFATLCGLALLSDTDWARHSDGSLGRAVRQNAVISRMRPYANGWIFAFLVATALLVYAANAGKLQGFVGKIVHVIEAVTAAAAYFLLSTTVLRDLPKPPPHHVAQMGVPVTLAILLGVAAFAALAAMMVVRFAIGLAVWLIPIPFVDVVFETLKKVLTLGFVVLYLMSPFLATVLAVGLAIVSLLMLRWALRLTAFVGGIVILPRLGLGMPRPADQRLRLRAAALLLDGFKRRESAVFAVADGAFQVFRSQLDALPVLTFLPSERFVLVRGVCWSELRETDDRGTVLKRIAFATPAFDIVQKFTLPLGVRVDQSRLSAWLAPSSSGPATAAPVLR